MRQLGLVGLALLSVSAFACSASSKDDSSSSDNAIQAGIPATAHEFDAVGNIAEVLATAPDGTATILDSKCTATLIGPHSILTASHCATKYAPRDSFQYTEHRFRTGADSAHPTHEVRIVGKINSPDLTGGAVGLGSDVAVFQLADDITDITPLPIGAVPTSDDIGKQFIGIGYGFEGGSDTVGRFRVRSFGAEALVNLTGSWVKALFPSPDALLAYWNTFTAGETLDDATAFYNDPGTNLVDGQQAYFSGVHDHGIQACDGDSGSPVLRKTATGYEIVAVTSATPSVGDFCWGGVYAGLPGNADNTTFIAAQLADPSEAVPENGYCNATSAIRSASVAASPGPLESETAIHIFDCATIGQVCAMQDGFATCVDPQTTGTTSACTFTGAQFLHPRGAIFQFNADGTFSIRGNPYGTYTLTNGILTMNDTAGDCLGLPGSYAVNFSADCKQFTLNITADQCQIRSEGFDNYPYVRQ